MPPATDSQYAAAAIAASAEEKKQPSSDTRSSPSVSRASLAPEGLLQRWFTRLDNIPGLEARGIERVTEDLRHPKPTTGSYLQMFIIWFAVNCTANNMTVGILGPAAYGLGFKDAIVCCLFGTIFGSACTGYISAFGPMSGLRTLVVARYTMGYWPSMLCVVLNIVIELGYGLVDCLVAGLILSAVNGHGMTVIVGIIVSALITWLVAGFGIRWFHTFERYIWIPTVLLLFILIGSAGPNFNTDSPSKGTGSALIANRVSYFFLAASGPLGWAPAAADFYSYYPSSTSRLLTAAVTTSGITAGKLLIEFLGIGLASGLATVPAWADAFDQSTGALIVEAFAPLGGFGKFCAVVLALCVSANIIPGAYAAALNFQMFGPWFAKVPRPIWSTVVVIIFTVCAIAGRAQLLLIFLNFLALIGYWVIIWIAMTVEEEVIFRRHKGYEWDSWADKTYLPTGYAALTTFLIGWAGAIVCMSQTYYVGPIAKLASGADIGLPVAMALSLLAYPPLRMLELKIVGR
ncbi:hypothetical protein GQ53DRAFT_862264 [Thozetella sp. PMI_491]|nr:hypothetical protein GQ53DRAFT_862264 [Thozetella sp. PMI_491]